MVKTNHEIIWLCVFHNHMLIFYYMLVNSLTRTSKIGLYIDPLSPFTSWHIYVCWSIKGLKSQNDIHLAFNKFYFCCFYFSFQRVNVSNVLLGALKSLCMPKHYKLLLYAFLQCTWLHNVVHFHIVLTKLLHNVWSCNTPLPRFRVTITITRFLVY